MPSPQPQSIDGKLYLTKEKWLERNNMKEPEFSQVGSDELNTVAKDMAACNSGSIWSHRHKNQHDHGTIQPRHNVCKSCGKKKAILPRTVVASCGRRNMPMFLIWNSG